MNPTPESHTKVASVETAVSARGSSFSRRAVAVIAVAGGLFLFVLALEILKAGASGITGVLRGLASHGFANLLGFGWLMAYLSLSGSPVAATSLTLLGGGTLTPLETFAMINGSRFGASFIVLFTGFLYYLRGLRGRGVVSMGVLSMLTTATIYLPAMAVGAVVVNREWLAGVRFGSPRALNSFIDVVYGPITAAAQGALPDVLVFLLGFACLLAAFRFFDHALPTIDAETLQTRWGRWLDRPFATFLLGCVVTSVTLSVSVSLSVLVPLAARGYMRRDQVIPYIMGANITTFVDTLFASLLVRAPEAFSVVLAELLSVAAVSLLVLLTAYRPYQKALLGLNRYLAEERRRFFVFVAVLALAPLTLLLL